MGQQALVLLLSIGSLRALFQLCHVDIDVALEDSAGADEGSLQGSHEAAQAQILPCKRVEDSDGSGCGGDLGAARALCSQLTLNAAGHHHRHPSSALPTLQLPAHHPLGLNP